MIPWRSRRRCRHQCTDSFTLFSLLFCLVLCLAPPPTPFAPQHALCSLPCGQQLSPPLPFSLPVGASLDHAVPLIESDEGDGSDVCPVSRAAALRGGHGRACTRRVVIADEARRLTLWRLFSLVTLAEAAAVPRCIPLNQMSINRDVALSYLKVGFEEDDSPFCGAESPRAVSCQCDSINKCHSKLDPYGRNVGVCKCCGTWLVVCLTLFCLALVLLVPMTACMLCPPPRGSLWWVYGYPKRLDFGYVKLGQPGPSPPGVPFTRSVFTYYRPENFVDVNDTNADLETSTVRSPLVTTAATESRARRPQVRLEPRSSRSNRRNRGSATRRRRSADARLYTVNIEDAELDLRHGEASSVPTAAQTASTGLEHEEGSWIPLANPRALTALAAATAAATPTPAMHNVSEWTASAAVSRPRQEQQQQQQQPSLVVENPLLPEASGVSATYSDYHFSETASADIPGDQRARWRTNL